VGLWPAASSSSAISKIRVVVEVMMHPGCSL